MKNVFIKLLEIVIGPLIVGLVLLWQQDYNSSDIQEYDLKNKNQEKLISALRKDVRSLVSGNEELYGLHNTQEKKITQLLTAKETDTPPEAIDIISPRITLKTDVAKWRTILDISWVKNTNFIGFNMVIDTAPYATFSPEKIPFFVSLKSLSKSKALVYILDGDDKLVLDTQIFDGGHTEFEFRDNKYKFTVIDIRGTGFTDSLAMYFTIEIANQ